MANPTEEISVKNVELSCQNKTSVKFTSSESILTALSLFIYLVDIVTDVILGVQYLKSGYYEWGILTIMLCIVPLIVTQLISLRWHQVDGTPVDSTLVLLHCSLLGVVHRYTMVLKLGFQSRQTKESVPHLQHHQSDICLLRLFESFLESAPQLLLQLYVMHQLASWHPWTGVCAFGSLVSLAWGIASYARTMRIIREDKARITWKGFALQSLWRTGTMVSRMMSLLLCAAVLHNWFFLAISIHWFAMTWWTVRQKTDLCSTAWEERVYNSVVGVVYCFCFFNLKEGPSRHRAMVFYTITAAENAACLAMFLQFSQPHERDQWLHTAAPLLIVAGSLIGHTSQLVYYRWFHPSGPIKIVATFASNTPAPGPIAAEEGSTLPAPSAAISNPNPVVSVRTLKYINPMSRKFSGVSLASSLPEPVTETEISSVVQVSTEDSAPIQPIVPTPDPAGPKCRSFKSTSDSSLIVETASKLVPKMPKSKSEGQLLASCSVENHLPDGEDLTAADTSVHSSIHDYENLATLNVNRTDWGIRHWKSYSDIENSFHDNSVCKEREALECSTTSASSADSSRVVPATNKISVEEAISQLKSLAVRGHNIFQPDAASIGLYECIWSNMDGNSPANRSVKPCPTRGHNLSIITELSEGSSTSSNRSKSSLVRTVDAIMDGSICESSTLSSPACQDEEGNEEQLTYVEVSFLSKLDGSTTSDDAAANVPSPKRPAAARRQFSIIREQFGPPIKAAKRSPRRSPKVDDKENNHPTLLHQSPLDKVKSPSQKQHQSTLSPRSRIFSP